MRYYFCCIPSRWVCSSFFFSLTFQVSAKSVFGVSFFFFFFTLLLSRFWTSRGHRCCPFFPPVLAFNFYSAYKIQQSHCSSIFHRVLLTHALALSASQIVHKKKSQRIYTSMHSAGLELTKLTYTKLEDNLIRHRGDRCLRYGVPLSEPEPRGGKGCIPTVACVIAAGAKAAVGLAFASFGLTLKITAPKRSWLDLTWLTPASFLMTIFQTQLKWMLRVIFCPCNVFRTVELTTLNASSLALEKRQGKSKLTDCSEFCFTEQYFEVPYLVRQLCVSSFNWMVDTHTCKLVDWHSGREFILLP